MGKLHPTAFVSTIESGDISILTENGVRRFVGASTQVCPADTKRLGFTHEDTVMYTVHANPTNERDIEKIDKIIHADDPFMIPHENLPFNLADIMIALCGENKIAKEGAQCLVQS